MSIYLGLGALKLQRQQKKGYKVLDKFACASPKCAKHVNPRPLSLVHSHLFFGHLCIN